VTAYILSSYVVSYSIFPQMLHGFFTQLDWDTVASGDLWELFPFFLSTCVVDGLCMEVNLTLYPIVEYIVLYLQEPSVWILSQ
jgi:hypothetical protein